MFHNKWRYGLFSSYLQTELGSVTADSGKCPSQQFTQNIQQRIYNKDRVLRQYNIKWNILGIRNTLTLATKYKLHYINEILFIELYFLAITWKKFNSTMKDYWRLEQYVKWTMYQSPRARSTTTWWFLPLLLPNDIVYSIHNLIESVAESPIT